MRVVVGLSLTLAILATAGCDLTITSMENDLAEDGGSTSGGAESECPICPAGYTPVGTECVWFGGPRNGDFSEEGEWDIEGAVVIDVESEGMAGPGAARFLPEAVCAGGALHQAFEMPAYRCAEPLALLFTAVNPCEFCLEQPILDIDINGGRHRHYVWDTAPQTVCLGERAYGQTAHLTVSTAQQTCTPSYSEVMLDDVDVYPAVTREPMGLEEGMDVPVCAPPGEIVNGDFEEGIPGWTEQNDGAQVGNGHGVGGTRGVRLYTDSCDIPRITGTASLPMHENTPNPALSFWVDGRGSDQVVVSYGTHAIGAVSETPSQTVSLCIPRWAQGVAQPLDIGMHGYDHGCVGSTSEYRLDAFEPKSEPLCEDHGLIFDGSFESLARTPNASSWWRAGHAMASGELAHDGETSLQLELGDLCETAAARQTITIPAGAKKPAVRLFYQTRDLAGASFIVQSQPLPASDGAWAEHVICLEPSTADVPHTIEMRTEFIGGACPGSASSVFVDSVEVVPELNRPCD